MQHVASTIQVILRRHLDRSATVEEVDAAPFLSPFLSSSFDLYKAHAIDQEFFVAEDVADSSGAKKRLAALAGAIGESVAVYLRSAAPSQRKSLIEDRQGFITQSGDLYLPQLALAIQANPPAKSLRARNFSPAQQQAFLYCLYHDEPLTQEGLREVTGMSAAGASRALSSLADEGLIDFATGGKTGRKRCYFVPDRKELFLRGKKLFGDPVKSVLTIPVSAQAAASPTSGLSALAARSDLVAPARRVIAVDPVDGRDLERKGDVRTQGEVDVHVLRYDPRPFASSGMVDPFTMLMTIDERDERISMALRDALGDCEWYVD